MTDLRPLLLVLPLCGVIVAVAALLTGTIAYIVGGAVIVAFVLLLLPAALSHPTWKGQEAEGLVPAGPFWH